MRRQIDIKTSSVLADGKIMTDAEMAAYSFLPCNNVELIQKCNQVLDPNFAKSEYIRCKYERAAQRKEELIRQAIELQKEISLL